MDLAEEFVKYLDPRHARAIAPDDLGVFAKFVDKELLARLDFVLERPFQRITYTEAIELLKKSGEKFEFPVDYGVNLQSEHERWLTEKHFKCPVTVFNYPKEIKPFYMRLNDDGKTVTAMDVLVPGIGEIVGGSQREERLDVLEENMRRHKMDPADYKWYLDLRRYGTVPHAGFGLGFERMLMFVTGVANIRDVIPFARTPGSAWAVWYSTTIGEYRRIALAQPEAVEGSHMNHPDFRVRNKIFATIYSIEECEGSLKLTPEQQRTRSRNIQKFSAQPPCWGRNGSTIVNIEIAKNDVVERAMRCAWCNTAPKRMVAQFESE